MSIDIGIDLTPQSIVYQYRLTIFKHRASVLINLKIEYRSHLCMQVIGLKGETQCHNDQSVFMRIRTSLRKN